MLINTERTLDEHFILGFIARKEISQVMQLTHNFQTNYL